MTFPPELGDVYLTMGITGALFALMVWLAVRANRGKHPDPRRRVLLPMLAYFMALLCLMAFLGAFWSLFKFPTVRVEPTQLIIDGTAYRLPTASNVRMEAMNQSSLGGGGRLLLVQTDDRRTWAFPEERYDINALYTALRER